MRARLRTLASTLGLIEDSPHRIALGLAIGLWLAWTPTVGLQTLLVLPIVWAMRANTLAALIGIYLSNPFTFLPMYWVEYELGAMFLSDPPTLSDFTQDGEIEGAMELTSMGWQMWLTMWIGGVILGFLTAIPAYFATRWFLIRARARRAAVKLAVEPVS
jgi:uncharacterized protein